MNLEEYIEGLREKHDLSLSEVAAKLGYKSKTSLLRLMHGNVRPETVLKFERAVLAAFDLSKEERTELSAIVQISIFGEERHLVNQAIWEFVQGKKGDSAQATLDIVDIKSGEIINLNERYGGADRIRLTVVNCQNVSALFKSVYLLLQRDNAIVDQFIYVNNNDVRTIRSVGLLMSVFYEKNYMGYSRWDESVERQRDVGLKECDLLIISWSELNGEAHSDIVFFRDSYRGTLMEVPFISGEQLRLLGLDKRIYVPIKRNYFECSAFEDYVKYSMDYAALEKDRAVWKIKPDVGVDQIPAQILRRAVQEEMTPPDDQFSEVLDKLEAVYRDRFKNSFSKRKHTYTVFKRGAMRRFAMTGKTTDHFWMMRPFTPEERIAILAELLKQEKENPYVHFYFLKEDATLRDVEIAYYDGVGMLILESETNYNLKQGHSEVMITHQRMLSLYKGFFMDVLLKEYVASKSETCDYLRHLIFEVEALVERKRTQQE